MFLVFTVFTMLLCRVQNENITSECEIGYCVQTCHIRENMTRRNEFENSSNTVTDLLNINDSTTTLISMETTPQCEKSILISPAAIESIKEDGLNVLQSLQLGLNYTEFCVDTVTYNDSLLFCIIPGDIPNKTSFESMNQICARRKCVRKCCGFGQSKFTETCAVSNSSQPGKNLSDDTQFLIYSELNCAEDYSKIKIDDFVFSNENSIYWAEVELTIEIDKYCIDHVFEDEVMDSEESDGGIAAFICVQDVSDVQEIRTTGMIISMPFLLMTLLVYAILPETSLHRKALMCYVSSLLIGYMILVSTQLSGPIPTVLCHVLGYSIIFFFTVSFFWMNVMCLDMWWAFSGMRAYNGFRGSEMKRFLFYCLYAFGIPSVHVFFVFMLNTYGDKNAYYHPLLGEKKCYVEDGLPELLYFYLPMAFVIIVNIVLFILTTIKIRKVKRETAMLKHSDSKRHSYEDDKQKFQLYLKLLLAMGVNWSMEVISWAVTWKLTKAPTWIWYLTDFTNATYGAVIFFIFVFKKKIWISLKKRYYVWVGKPHLAHAMSRSTPGTRTSQFSTTDTGYDHRMSELKNTKEEERALN